MPTTIVTGMAAFEIRLSINTPSYNKARRVKHVLEAKGGRSHDNSCLSPRSKEHDCPPSCSFAGSPNSLTGFGIAIPSAGHRRRSKATGWLRSLACTAQARTPLRSSGRSDCFTHGRLAMACKPPTSDHRLAFHRKVRLCSNNSVRRAAVARRAAAHVQRSRVVPSRRRDCHFDDTSCLSLLKQHLIKVQGVAIK